MEMHQVRYFLAVCRTLNFTRAAERCNVAQPSLTRAIQKLEEELGGALFRRERNRTHLTDLGRLMQPHLRALQDASLAASAEAEDYHKLERAPLRLGVMCTIGPARLVNFFLLQDALGTERRVGAGPTSVVLQAAVHPVRVLHVDAHPVVLTHRQVRDVQERPSHVIGDAKTPVVALHHVSGVGWIHPEDAIVSVGRVPDRTERATTVVGPAVGVHHVDALVVVWIDQGL